MSNLAATFDTIIDTVGGKLPPAGSAEISANDAYSAFQNVLSRTIMPRRITFRGADGARVSVIAKNRRVINLSEVHPQSNWDGDVAPEKTECEADFDTFAKSFASALVKTVNGESIRIEQSLLSDPLGTTKAGYPSGMLVEHIEQSQKRVPAGAEIASFFEANDGLPRARFGDEIEITIPAGSSITHDWMQTRIDEALKDLSGSEVDLRFLTLDGEKPMALALAWMDGQGAVVVSDDAEKFADLEQKLSALRGHL